MLSSSHIRHLQRLPLHLRKPSLLLRTGSLSPPPPDERWTSTTNTLTPSHRHFASGFRLTPVLRTIYLKKSGGQGEPVGGSGEGGDEALKQLLAKIEENVGGLLTANLEEEDKMSLSALYMQATYGKCLEKKPKRPEDNIQVIFWKDWKALGDMPRVEAAKKYLEIAEKYLPG